MFLVVPIFVNTISGTISLSGEKVLTKHEDIGSPRKEFQLVFVNGLQQN